MQITTILAFITAMGGLEAVKWLVRYITCHKTDARKEEASVNSMVTFPVVGMSDKPDNIQQCIWGKPSISVEL